MQKRDKYKSIEDFLSNKSFRLWILYNLDHDNWEEWTLENPYRAKLVVQARLWILAMKVDKNKIDENEIQNALQATWKKIELAESSKNISKLIYLKSTWIKIVAATLFLSFIVTVFWELKFFDNDTNIVYKELLDNNNEGLVEQINNTEKPQIITLSDGSSVLLQPNSKLSYPKTFVDNERKVYLSGEGFFEISKNPKKPFFVYANEIITRVVGTSFKISAYKDQPDVVVLVKTGKVEVHSNKKFKNSTDKEITLLPDQTLHFERENLEFSDVTTITTNNDLKQLSKNIEQLDFNFKNTPVNQIFTTLEQAYLVDIDFPEEKLQNCQLTTSLSDQPLPEKLKIICKSISDDTYYQMNGNQIIITSEGCN